jgi:sugar/nucleoside kinase (ribokinase family)
VSDRPGRVLVVGDVMTDIICKPAGALVVGSDRRAAIQSKPGGSGANQAVWLGAMGVDVRFAARVGAADVRSLEAYFRGFGVDPILFGDAERSSGVLVTIVDPDGERSFLTDRGANLGLSSQDLALALLEGVRLVVVSGYCFFAEGPRQAVMELCAAARAREISVAVDPASVGFLEEVGVANFLSWTASATTIFANEAEALALTDAANIDEQMRALGATYSRVVIKRGAEGAVLGERSGVTLNLRAPRVEVLDTTGAGDAFAAGFIAAELAGWSTEACLRAGIEAGSKAVQTIGGQPASPKPAVPSSPSPLRLRHSHIFG